ncbi:MAG: type I DNA topoisomerase [Sumerlaeia bacterium]
MSTLVIVESPAKAKTIEKFLGKGYTVRASFGHVRDLPSKADEVPASIKGEKWANLGVNVEKDFEPVYVIPGDKKKRIDELKKHLKDADELLLATDEDREGESISWHLLEVLKPKVPVRRIVFHEITKEAIQHAIANARDVDLDLVHAQESRRIVDRLYGYSLSPVLWRKVQKGLSAGRVQSVAVRLIVEREEERRVFVPASYWDLEAGFRSATGEFAATLSRLGKDRIASGRDFEPETGKLKKGASARHLQEQDALRLTETVRANLPWRVGKVEEKPGVQRPAPPFTTSTLQQEANRKLGYGAKRTMQIAQRLYEGIDLGGGERVGLITYMRTDSQNLAEKALGEAQQQIKTMYGAEYATGPRRYKTKSRSAQEAHEAIRPTDLSRRPQDMGQYLDKDDARLYELIWKRTLASQMPDAKVLRKTVEITADGGPDGEAAFTATGKTITFPGYLRAYVEGSDDPNAELGDKETILPDLKEGQEIPRAMGAPKDATVLKTVEAKGHTTSPPARFTEASLVKKLEEEGVGRPSTYASIISTIQDRGYVFRQSNALVPTYTAMAVTNLLRDHFGDYVDVKFTARMEEDLDEVANGHRDWVGQVRAFFLGSDQNGATDGRAVNGVGLEEMIGREMDAIGLPDVVIGTDPDSNQRLVVRIGRYGPYIVRGEGGEGNTADVPEKVAPADFSAEQALELLSQKKEGPRVVGEDPETGLEVLVMTGRYGPYVQLGETPDDKKAPKPKRASLPKDMAVDEVELPLALKLLSLPRTLGTHPDDGEPVLANEGRFGPYVQHNREFRSLEETDNVHTVTYERAMELLSQPKKGRKAAKKAASAPLKVLGQTAAGADIKLLEGRYGPYVTDGQTNATIPKGTDPANVTPEQAKEWLAAKASKGPAKKSAKKASAKKSSAKKKGGASDS